MKKWIVITTINPPQEAVRSIAKLSVLGFNCVVVGDNKTPPDWNLKGVEYLSVADQRSLFPEISDELPYNHYCRKNIGYLYAIREGANYILETDDDNIPLDNFGSNISESTIGRLVGGAEWVNVYKYFTDRLVWPRGNPLDLIHEKGVVLNANFKGWSPIQQFLANGDPDVDAIYRLIEKNELNFENNSPVFLSRGTWCSFNSQNTLFFDKYFELLYLPCFVSFRMTDIWRSFVAQNILWSEGQMISFQAATVKQVRNQHDLMKDFRDEIDGYLNNKMICRTLSEAAELWTSETSVTNKVYESWMALKDAGFIQNKELDLVNSWLSEMESIRRKKIS